MSFTNTQKVLVGLTVIAVATLLVVATGGVASPAVACFAMGAFEGSVCKCQANFYIVDEKTPYHVMVNSSYRAHL